MMSFFDKISYGFNAKSNFDEALDQIGCCLKSPYLMTFLEKYEHLVTVKKSSNYFTTMGINFKDEKPQSIKFYAHILEEMTESEILQFIPRSEDYLKFLPFKSRGTVFNAENVGTVLEIKFNENDKMPSYGFFYMLKNNEAAYNAIERLPSNIPSDFIKDIISLGVNFEYKNEKHLYKKYYYFNQPKIKAFFERKFEFPLSKNTNHIEYAISDTFSKVNIYGAMSDLDINSRIFTRKERQIINFLNERFGLINIGYGFYENHAVKSIYFRDNTTNDKIATLSKVIK